jgi:hypothetical protein
MSSTAVHEVEDSSNGEVEEVQPTENERQSTEEVTMQQTEALRHHSEAILTLTSLGGVESDEESLVDAEEGEDFAAKKLQKDKLKGQARGPYKARS